MNQMLSLSQRSTGAAEADHMLAQCNAKTKEHGLVLNKQEVTALIQRRNDALREAGRIEFGQGPLVELASAFGGSPYVSEDTYVETLGELQEVFYQLKEVAEEAIPDDDLVEALHYLFDEKAHGSIDYFEGVTSKTIQDALEALKTDDNADWSEEETYRTKEKDEAEEYAKALDETDRIYEQDRYDRPDNRYADNFYDGHRELYRSGFDSNSRIGGSSL